MHALTRIRLEPIMLLVSWQMRRHSEERAAECRIRIRYGSLALLGMTKKCANICVLYYSDKGQVRNRAATPIHPFVNTTWNGKYNDFYAPCQLLQAFLKALGGVRFLAAKAPCCTIFGIFDFHACRLEPVANEVAGRKIFSCSSALTHFKHKLHDFLQYIV